MFRAARLKLTAGYAGALGLILLVLGVSTFVVVRNSLDDDITASIEVALADLERTDPVRFTPTFRPGAQRGSSLNVGQPIGDLPDGPKYPHDDGRAAAILASDIFYIFAGPGGAVLANPRQVQVSTIDIPALIRSAQVNDNWQDVSSESGSFRLATYEVQDAPAGSAYLIVGKSLDSRDRNLQTLIQTLLIVGGLGMIASIGGGFILAGRALAPIQQSLEAQRRFVSDASHELRTPVAVVRANNELLQLHPEQRIGDNLEQVEAIGSEAEHMSRLVDDLLTLARADEGRLAERKDLVDLGELATAIARQMQPVAQKRGIAIEPECGVSLVVGDEGRLRQLILILVDNAVKYSPAGGTVRIGCTRAGKQIELHVSDNGQGIAPEDMPRLFDRFYRAEAARTRNESGGLGLGLAIAKEIASAHGGRITVESRPGAGSTFTVRLKAATT